MATQGFKTRNRANDLFESAANQLGGEQVGNAFRGLQQASNPFVNQLLSQQNLIAQTGAQGISANLGRAGLGNTGLGAALGGGLRAGVALQGQNLRARIGQEMFSEALQNQRMKAQSLLQQSQAIGTSPEAGFGKSFFESGGLGSQILSGAVQAGATALGGPVGGAVAQKAFTAGSNTSSLGLKNPSAIFGLSGPFG